MQRKSLWGSYKALDPRTRIWIGVGKYTLWTLSIKKKRLNTVFVGGMVFATIGIAVSDYLERKFPATEREKIEAEALSPIIVVDREKELR